MIRSCGDAVPRLARGAWVDEQACVVGDVTLGEDTSVWPMAVVRGDVNRVIVLDRAVLGEDTLLAAGTLVPPGKALEAAGCTAAARRSRCGN